MRVLVTGSSGYVGNFLVPRLQQKGFETVGADKVNSPRNAPAKFYHGDLGDEGFVDTIFKNEPDINGVIHLAAAKADWGISDETYFKQNVSVTEKILEKASAYNITNHVFYSTVSVYGPSEKPLCEDAEKKPINAYGQSKVRAETLYRKYYEKGAFENVIIIRPSVIFGRYHYTNVYRLIDAIYKNRFLMIGNGENIKTTSYIENVIEATIFLLEKKGKGWHICNYVDSPKLKTREMVDLIYYNLAKKRFPFSLPPVLVKPVACLSDIAAEVLNINFPITASRINKFCTSTNFDASAIRKWGFAQPVANDEAFEKTVRWQMKQYT